MNSFISLLQRNQSFSKWSIFILLICSISSMHLSLHTQSTTKEYDKNTYYLQLNGIQNRFKQDIKRIKDKFTAINLELNNTNITASDQVIFLQQTLADQRDALYNIQKYLAIPFALRSCQCVNLTDQKKDSIKAQISNTSKSIQDLKNSLGLTQSGSLYDNPQCPKGKCPVVEQIQSQISQLQSYVKIMNDTITSQCCKIVNYVYRDNLVDSNQWIYGNTTENQYRKGIFQRLKNNTSAQCPKDLPFANIKSNQCFACSSQAPIFNLGRRQCQIECQAPLILNQDIHNCDYNRNCPANQYFNNITLQCEKNLGTMSNCPKDRPFWNKAILTCQKCQQDKPFYDNYVQSCRTCTQNENWDQQSLLCLEKVSQSNSTNCPPGTYYNPSNKICQIIQIPKVTGSVSQCPPQKPFWSSADYTCYKCQLDTPYYNSSINICQPCPKDTAWNNLLQQCTSSTISCLPNQVYNNINGKCEAKTAIINCLSNEIYNSNTKKCQVIGNNGQIGLCPPEQPYWNEKQLVCENCNSITPKWNKNLRQCQACPKGTIWSAGNCIALNPNCSYGMEYNSNSQKCQKISCANPSPWLNPNTNKCEACPQDYFYNSTNKNCQRQSQNSTTVKLNGNTSICDIKQPIWNSKRLACQPCALGTSWNPTINDCVKPTHFLIKSSHHSLKTNYEHTVIENHEDYDKIVHERKEYKI